MFTPMFLLVVIGITALFALACIRRIPEGQAYTLRRFGGHIRAVGAGIHLVLPVIERVAHRIRLLGNVVNVDRVSAAPRGPAFSGEIYFQVVDAERADAVIDRVDSVLCGCLRSQLADAGDEDVAVRNQRIKLELNRQVRDRGILITRVQIAEA
jgi:regulator of protease activity HflC (stomatin/prohibitin superfamily)